MKKQTSRAPYKKAGSRSVTYKPVYHILRYMGFIYATRYISLYILLAYVYTAGHRGTAISRYYIQAVQSLAGQAAGNNRQPAVAAAQSLPWIK